MSYEGYVQMLCIKGHNWNVDCYMEGDNETCPVCKAPPVWRNSVDQTNCDEYGYVKLEVDVPAVICKCDKCGIEHTVEPVRYKIPPPDARENAIDEWEKTQREEDKNIGSL